MYWINLVLAHGVIWILLRSERYLKLGNSTRNIKEFQFIYLFLNKTDKRTLSISKCFSSVHTPTHYPMQKTKSHKPINKSRMSWLYLDWTVLYKNMTYVALFIVVTHAISFLHILDTVLESWMTYYINFLLRCRENLVCVAWKVERHI